MLNGIYMLLKIGFSLVNGKDSLINLLNLFVSNQGLKIFYFAEFLLLWALFYLSANKLRCSVDISLIWCPSLL